jgi:dihydrodipicolinate synthase/N-acetylneuraminate lyase
MEHVLAGLYVPLVTPLRADGELAADALETLAHSVIDAGAAGLVALGTTGEPATLSSAHQTWIQPWTGLTPTTGDENVAASA